jgi:hypothetical protein
MSEVTVEMFNAFAESVNNNMKAIIMQVASQIKMLQKQSMTEAVVIGYTDKPALEELYGPEGVQILCPVLGIGEESETYARLYRGAPGRIDIPELGSKGFVTFAGGDLSKGVFFPSHPLDARNSIDDGYTETSGFVDSIVPDDVVNSGRFAKEALENPGKFRILESSDKFILYEDFESKELVKRVGDGWKIKIQTGDKGEIELGNSDPLTDAEIGSTDIEMKMGLSGNLSAETVSGDVSFTTTSGNIDLETTSGKATIKAGPVDVQKAVLGEDTIQFLKDFIDAVLALTVPTALGPSGTAINAPDFNSLKTAADSLASASFKHN